MAFVLREGNEKRELTHSNENCVGCGICADVCPVSALKLGPILPIARGLLVKDSIKIQDSKCALCGLCASACPFNALDLKINGDSIKDMNNYPKWHHGTVIDKDECIYCGKCETQCPRDSIAMNRTLPSISDLTIGEIKTDVDKCIACKFCEDICPAGAITIKMDNEFNASAIEIDNSKCVYCKVCQRICPEDAIKAICSTCMESESIPEATVDGNIILAEDVCVNCGWCDRVCPVDAPTTIKPFEGNVELIETEKECKGDSCVACVDVCPCNAITMEDGKPVIDLDVCVLCGACAKVCPKKVLSVNRTSMKLDNIKSTAWENILNSILSK